MKITAISHLASPKAPTGAEKSLAFLAGALAEGGHETSVIAPGRWCLSEGLEGRGVAVAEIPSRPCWLVQWGHQPFAAQLLRWLRWRAPDPGFRRMMVSLDRFWPDVVHVNCLPQLKGAAAARALGLPVVWHVREIVPPGWRRRWFARRLARDASRIVAVSEAVAEWVRDEGLADRVTVVHNGVQQPEAVDVRLARQRYGLPADGVLVGFLGGMAVHKGAAELVRASDRAMEENSELRVVMATFGPAAEIEAIRARVAATAHAERFHLIPPVDDVFGLLAAVDMVAFSSIWPDSLPRVVMEAMAAGRPVVAHDIGGVSEMVIDGVTGFMVDPGDTDALANRVVQLAENPQLGHRFGAAAAARAQTEFSLEGHVGAMEQILGETAG